MSEAVLAASALLAVLGDSDEPGPGIVAPVLSGDCTWATLGLPLDIRVIR